MDLALVVVVVFLLVGRLVWPLLDERIAKIAVAAVVLMGSVFAISIGWPGRL